MGKAVKLSNIAITHISLVKDGANGKRTIFKSADTEPTLTREVKIAKMDEELGVVYGIVYSPGEVDTQGEFADAAEIRKASYAFVKQGFAQNVDKDHTFKNEDAFVAESWITKENDPLFPSDPVGSWAVGIKLESEELLKEARDGKLSALSMAGLANREEVEKADGVGTQTPGGWMAFFSSLAEVIEEGWLTFDTKIKKGEKNMPEDFKEQIKKKMQEATAPIAKVQQEQADSIEKINKEIETIKKENEGLKSENESLKKENDDLKKTVEKQVEEIGKLSDRTGEVEEALQKSKQSNDPKLKETQKQDDKKGTL